MKIKNILYHSTVSYFKAFLLFFLLFNGINLKAQGTYCPCVVPGFLYRAPVIINNSSGFALTGYQVVINITWNSHMNADFSDIRFRDSTCSDLPYWIETYTASTSAKFWVKVPYVPFNGAIIYMYYGNIGAVSASNSQTTFNFFDDFNDGDYTNNPTWTVAGSTFSAASDYLLNTGSHTTLNIYSAAINLPTTIGVMMEYDAMWTSTWCIGNEMYLYNSLGSTVLDGFNEYCDFNGSHNLSITSNVNSASIVNPPATNVWNHYKVSAFNGTYKIDYNNGAASVTTTGSTTITASKIRIGGWQDQSGSEFDNIRVRQYAVPEPTTATGAEEIDANNAASITPASTTTCAGQSSTLTASIGVSYHWSTGDTTISITLSPPITTIYTVSVTNASACVNTAAATVTINPLPPVNAGVNQTLCAGASVTLSGSGATTYSWDNGVTNGIPFSPLSTATYSVTGTDTNGCNNISSVTVAVDSNLTVSVTPSATAICIGTGNVLTACGASSYLWSPATGLSTTNGPIVTANPSSATTYTIIGTSGACSDTASVMVTVDSIPIISIVPNSTTICNGSSVLLTASGGTTYTWSPAAWLNATTGDSVTATPVATTTFTVIGMSGVCSDTTTSVVIINDTINPSITCPANITTVTNTGCTATGLVLGTPLTIDNCIVASVTNNALSAYPLGNTTVLWTVHDGSGNTAQCNQIVIVNDNVNPVITCPANVVAGTNTGCTATGVVLGTPVPSDNCSVASVTNNAPSVFPLGNTTVTWTVTDGSGNTAHCYQLVTINDNVNPAITCPADITTSTNTGCTATGVVLGTPVTSDNCSVASVTNNAPATFSLGITTIAWTVTDGAGNTALCIQTVIVNDNVNPVITCPANISTSTNTGCTATGINLGTPVTSDNCSVASVTNNAPSVFQLGNTTVTWTITDGSGNTVQCNQLVNVYYIPNVHITGDTVVCSGISTVLTASGGTTFAWSTSEHTASITVTPMMQTTYSVTVSDQGCSGVASITLHVNFAQGVDAGNDTTIFNWESIQLHAIGGVSWAWSPATGLNCTDCSNPVASPVSTTTYLVMAIDNNGCVSTDDITITIENNCGAIFVPNIFSPNGDNNNDILYVRGDCIKSMTFIIYDRWGEKIFSAGKAEEGWDGNFRGKPLDVGVYSFYLKAELYNNKEEIRKGTITLVR